MWDQVKKQLKNIGSRLGPFHGEIDHRKRGRDLLRDLQSDATAAVVVLDVDGPLASAVPRWRADAFQHELAILVPFGGAPAGFETRRFNPFSVVNLDSQHLLSDARHFARALVRQEPVRDVFYPQSVVLVIDAILSFLFCHGQPADCTLTKLREIVVDPDKLQAMAEMLLASDAAGGLLRLKGHQLNALVGKTQLDVIATANVQMNWMDCAAIRDATADTTMDLKQLLAGRMDVFVLLPVYRSEAYGPLVRCWVTAITHAIYAAEIDAVQPIRFYFDEAGQLSSLAN